MREMSASDASRRFSMVLDEAERGETIVVTRGGRRVALIVLASRANGGAVAEVLARWGSQLDVGEEFAANVATAGEVSVEQDSDPWRD